MFTGDRRTLPYKSASARPVAMTIVSNRQPLSYPAVRKYESRVSILK